MIANIYDVFVPCATLKTLLTYINSLHLNNTMQFIPSATPLHKKSKERHKRQKSHTELVHGKIHV